MDKQWFSKAFFLPLIVLGTAVRIIKWPVRAFKRWVGVDDQSQRFTDRNR